MRECLQKEAFLETANLRCILIKTNRSETNPVFKQTMEFVGEFEIIRIEK
jgi:hypothetical protein